MPPPLPFPPLPFPSLSLPFPPFPLSRRCPIITDHCLTNKLHYQHRRHACANGDTNAVLLTGSNRSTGSDCESSASKSNQKPLFHAVLNGLTSILLLAQAFLFDCRVTAVYALRWSSLLLWRIPDTIEGSSLETAVVLTSFCRCHASIAVALSFDCLKSTASSLHAILFWFEAFGYRIPYSALQPANHAQHFPNLRLHSTPFASVAPWRRQRFRRCLSQCPPSLSFHTIFCSGQQGS
jgi:hypothetical protein